jgi:hypothetical protein
MAFHGQKLTWIDQLYISNYFAANNSTLKGLEIPLNRVYNTRILIKYCINYWRKFQCYLSA